MREEGTEDQVSQPLLIVYLGRAFWGHHRRAPTQRKHTSINLNLPCLIQLIDLHNKHHGKTQPNILSAVLRNLSFDIC